MRSLEVPSTKDSLWLSRIRNSKENPTRALITSTISAVLIAYEDYEDCAPEVTNVTDLALSPEQEGALRHAYTSETAAMARLRLRLLKPPEVRRCPYCGISEATTLDHYLPKEVYAQYSIFPKNLVPCCPTCNVQKRAKVLDEHTGIRLFLHPYYDDIPDESVLKLSLRINARSIILNFKLRKPMLMSAQVFGQLTSHFELLQLADRYRLMSLDELKGQYQAIARVGRGPLGPQKVSEHLAEQAASFTNAFGANHWRSVLYQTLSHSREFCVGGFSAMRPH